MGKVRKLNEDLDSLLEFAFIPLKTKNGVFRGQVSQKSDREWPHVPRIKVFKNVPGPSFSVILDEDPKKIRVKKRHEVFVSESELNDIVKQVVKYKDVLLKFWNTPGMFSRDLDALIDEIDAKEGK